MKQKQKQVKQNRIKDGKQPALVSYLPLSLFVIIIFVHGIYLGFGKDTSIILMELVYSEINHMKRGLLSQRE